MNEKKPCSENEAQSPTPGEREVEQQHRPDPHPELCLHQRVEEEEEEEEEEEGLEGVDREEEGGERDMPAVQNLDQSDVPKEPGGGGVYVRKRGVRGASKTGAAGVGPPPRPFKKARYAWEIKNYEHTVSNMTQSLGECSRGVQQDSSDGHSEGSQEDGTLDPRDGLDRTPPFLDPRAAHHPDLIPPIMPAPYPTSYTMMGATAPPPGVMLPQGEVVKEGPGAGGLDPDAGILRWHTRQLCRSIFDNTVNRMLENMGFSPVTEGREGVHPLLVLSLSDDEEREAEEAQRALQHQALTAAMHHKGLFLPPYHYDALDSPTTTDYDSSSDDSDLPDDPGPDDLPDIPLPHALPPPMNLAPPGHTLPAMLAPPPPPAAPLPFSPQHPNKPDCDVDARNCDVSDPSHVNNTLPQPHPRDNEEEEEEEEEEEDEETRREAGGGVGGGVGGGGGGGGGGGEVRALEVPQHKTENENNNDKYFVDQAIEMAIKQQGLGYQQA
ncbi:hypothetical protein Pcinc_034049 [Petrolisthes cinctipes]|uniref:Uncharacterized protein n=1 Tax=Petrolisthes cinctipes TaxID=88211 RepID=A0AAE1EQZ1_PETCI|nr:hypothetical protein Pcinc_034049 [Petrolisthes cinctipes]